MKRSILFSLYGFILIQSVMQFAHADGNATTIESPMHYQLLKLAEIAIADCYEDEAETIKVNITDEGLDKLVQGSRDDLPRNTKCLRYCIMRKSKLFNDKNQLDVEQILYLYKIVHSSIDESILKTILNDCGQKSEKEKDRCERAAIATKCILDGLGQYGVKNI